MATRKAQPKNKGNSVTVDATRVFGLPAYTEHRDERHRIMSKKQARVVVGDKQLRSGAKQAKALVKNDPMGSRSVTVSSKSKKKK